MLPRIERSEASAVCRSHARLSDVESGREGRHNLQVTNLYQLRQALCEPGKTGILYPQDRAPVATGGGGKFFLPGWYGLRGSGAVLLSRLPCYS